MTAGIAVMAIACKPVPVGGPGTGGGGGGSATGSGVEAPSIGAAEDVTAELGPWTLKGVVFTPEALPPMQMRLVRVTPPVPLAKARAQWAKLARDGKPPKGAKATAAQVLASLLYEQAAADPSKKAEPLAEARAAIAALHGEGTDSTVDVVTLEMGAALAFAADDRAGAQPYLDELVRRFPADKVTTNARAQLAFARLHEGKNAEAAAVITGSEDTPEIQYVTAWLRFRQGDAAGAVASLSKAIAKWPDPAWIDPLARDYMVMAARGGVTAPDAALVIDHMYPDPSARFSAMLELPNAFALAGRPAEAAAALELVKGSTPPGASAADAAKLKEKLEKESAFYARLASGKPPIESEGGDAAAYAHAAKAAIDARRQEVQVCYEQFLQGDPTLAGALTLKLEVDQGGTVVGATAEPPEGEAGLAGVARCAVARVRTWRFPSRPKSGVARLEAAFTLAAAY